MTFLSAYLTVAALFAAMFLAWDTSRGLPPRTAAVGAIISGIFWLPILLTVLIVLAVRAWLRLRGRR